MAVQLFSNNASGALSAAITASATTLNLVSGQGAAFPVISGSGDFFNATLTTAGQSASSASEIVKVTATSTDQFTIVRAQEGTTAKAWNANDSVALLPTAGTLANFTQPQTLQQQATNYALDTGSANAYTVSLTPNLAGHVVGMPVRWLAGHANTGNSTFNDGAGAAPLLSAAGQQLAPGTIRAGGIYTSFWNGTSFQLGNSSVALSGSFTGTTTGGSQPSSGTVQYRISADGQFCTLYVNAQIPSGYSTSGGAIGLSGLPSQCVPAVTQLIPCVMLGGSPTNLPMAALAQVNQSIGTISFSLGATGSGNVEMGAFPTSAVTGPVGIPTSWSITYPLT